MVFDPLYEPLWMLRERFHNSVLPPNVLRPIIRMVVNGLYYLYTETHIIYIGRSNNNILITMFEILTMADLKSDNILIALRD